MVNDKSVGVYNKKKIDNDVMQQIIDIQAKEVDKLFSGIIKNSANLLSAIVFDTKYLLSPILDTAKKYRRQ